MIDHYLNSITKKALKQQRQAIFDQKREKDIIKNRLKVMNDVDVKQPDAQVTQYTIYDVTESGQVISNKRQEVKKIEEPKEEKEEFEFNKDARVNSEFVFDNVLPPLLIAWM